MFSNWTYPVKPLQRCASFDFDDARTKEAEIQLYTLQKLSHVETKYKLAKDTSCTTITNNNISRRNQYHSEMMAFRRTPYYLQIKARVDQHQELVPAELYFYAMATDNVSKLNLQSLQEMSFYFHFHPLTENFRTLMCALKWQTETLPDAKQALSKELRSNLLTRVSKYADDNNLVHFLNLRGINLSGANLTGSNMIYIDLELADLSNCKLCRTHFDSCILDYANLRAADCFHEKDQHQSDFITGPTIRNCSARHATFDGMNAFSKDMPELISWTESDFTGASFKEVQMSSVDFNQSILDEADFEGSLISFCYASGKDNCSMHNANLVGAGFHRTNYEFLDESIKFVSNAALHDTDKFTNELDKLCRMMLQKINSYADQSVNTIQLECLSIKIAESLIHQVNNSDLSDICKVEILNCAIHHQIFQPAEAVKHLANTANRYYQAASALLFSAANQGHEYYSTPAIHRIEQARDICQKRVANTNYR